MNKIELLKKIGVDQKTFLDLLEDGTFKFKRIKNYTKQDVEEMSALVSSDKTSKRKRDRISKKVDLRIAALKKEKQCRGNISKVTLNNERDGQHDGSHHIRFLERVVKESGGDVPIYLRKARGY